MEFEWSKIREQGCLHEDEHTLVLNKPAGISVMGERSGTDLVKLAAASDEELFPAHRIDKVTSGVILFAKSKDAHGPLTRQFAKRSVEKQYVAVVNALDVPPSGLVKIDLPLMTASNARVRIAADRSSIQYDSSKKLYAVPSSARRSGVSTYDSETYISVLGSKEGRSLLSVWPTSGRRHQIRVHLAWIGFPILGDPLFRTTSDASNQPRTMLHAFRLKVQLPWSETEHIFEASPDEVMQSCQGLEGAHTAVRQSSLDPE